MKKAQAMQRDAGNAKVLQQTGNKIFTLLAFLL